MKWLDNLFQRAREQRYRSGYDWAAGELLRGTPVLEIEDQLNNPFDSDEFEVGGKRAMWDFLFLTETRKAMDTQPKD